MTQQKDQMKISVLASGSSGNVTYVETEKHKVLIDAGLSGKKIETLMNSIGRTLKDVDSLFVTHDAMSKKVGKIPLDQKHVFKCGSVLSLDDLDIESFGVSHDASEPQFYELHHHDSSFAIVTDTGYVSPMVAGIIQDAEAYLFECNHDTEMLRMGAYPWPLKQRILGDTGHLSNEDGANALMSVIGNRTKQIYLGHLSRENNVKELAHLTVDHMMRDHDFAVDHDFYLHDTDPEKATPLIAL